MQPPLPGSEQATQPINILIVDDEPRNLTVLETILDDPGYRLRRAGSADEALLALVSEEFALLILDIRMPGMTGLELAHMVKQRKKTSRVPIIFLTAYYNEDQHVLEGYGSGAVDYMIKPANPAVLRSKVAVFAELHRKNLELEAANRALLAEVSERTRAEDRLRVMNETLERRVTERTGALRDSENRLRAIHDGTNEFLGLLGPDGTILEANRAALSLVGVSREGVIGSPIWEATWLGRTPDVSELVRQAVGRSRAGEVVRLEVPVIAASGEPRTLDVCFRPMRDEDEAVIHIVVVGMDVTERKRIEQELREADRRKDEFLAMLAHELRNPLAPISAGLQILKLGPPERQVQESTREMMERQLNHMVRLINDLLDVSRISHGKIKLHRTRVRLRTVVEHAIETSGPIVEAAGQRLEVGPVDDSAWLDCDLTRLAQVLSNLLNNSAKYTPKGGRIWITTAREAGWVTLRVADDGIGLSAEMVPRVFDLFTQVDRTLDRAQGGLGIGLALASKLVELHGGTIAGDSPGLGLGSTFTIRLPTATPDVEPAPSATNGDRSPASQAKSLRVLVVDDSEDAAASLAALLNLWGHSTCVAHNGLDAVRLAVEFGPELAFLDIGLPDIDGYEVCRRMRARPALAGASFVALTGWGTEADKARAMESGFDQHLTKPFVPDQLLAVLMSVAAKPGA